jgi:hypothetical protein
VHDRHLECALSLEVEGADMKGKRRLHPLVDRAREHGDEASGVRRERCKDDDVIDAEYEVKK